MESVLNVYPCNTQFDRCKEFDAIGISACVLCEKLPDTKKRDAANRFCEMVEMLQGIKTKSNFE